MRLQTQLHDIGHTEIGTAVTWSNDNDIFSAADDRTLIKFTATSGQTSKICEFDGYITCLSWNPSLSGQSSDTFVVGFSDGSFRIVSKNGHEEKTIAAHSGAVIGIQWNNDGSALLTCSEDGEVKIWSRNGNLRSTLMQSGDAIYSIHWIHDCESVLLSSGSNIIIKSVQAGKQSLRWNGHDSTVVFCTDWSPINDTIISGGEDCKYKIWDSFGRLLWSSQPFLNFITSLAWNTNGETFAVGSFNQLLLCDKSGYVMSESKLDSANDNSSSSSGSIYSLSWNRDGTRLASSTGSGQIMIAHLIGQSSSDGNTNVTAFNTNTIHVQNQLLESTDIIDLHDEFVVQVSVGFDFIIIGTASSLMIFATSNPTSPFLTIPLRSSPILIRQCDKCFLSVDLVGGVCIWSYDNNHHVQSNIKFKNLNLSLLTTDMIDVCSQVVAIVDTSNPTSIKFFDTVVGRTLNIDVNHLLLISCIRFSQLSIPHLDIRLLAFLDKNNDLFINQISLNSTNSESCTSIQLLASHVDSFVWHSSSETLAALGDGRLMIWYYPNILYVDKDLLAHAKTVVNMTEINRSCSLTGFHGSMICVKKEDGSALSVSSSSSFASTIYNLARSGQWKQALVCCRRIRQPEMWACLAGLSIACKELDVAQECLSSLGFVDKVDCIQRIKAIPNGQIRMAELHAFRRNFVEAERMLLSFRPEPLVLRAIKLNINLSRWRRALELAVNNRQYLDIVIGYRERWLQYLGRCETDEMFVKAKGQSKVLVDWNIIEEKERAQEELEEKVSSKLK